MKPWSLRRRVAAAFIGASVLTLIALAIGALSFLRLMDARHRVIERLDPAALAQRDLLAALVSQESAVRGFILTGNETFLVRYDAGQRAQDQATAQLRDHLDSTQLALVHVASVNALADDWRSRYASREIERARLSGPGESSPENLTAARNQFERVRADLDLLDEEIAQARRDAKRDLTTATGVLLATLAVTTAVVFAVGAFARVAWTRWTMRPLEQLGAATRSVAVGDLHTWNEVTGPVEITGLANDVDAMRERILHELAQLEQARSELDERAVDLARSNADLEQFAYVASHDLQEPLRKVTSFCQLLQRRYEGQLDERADQYIEFAVDGARRMQVLINDLLAFSRIGRNTGHFTDVDMQDLAIRALSDLEDKVVESGGKVSIGDLPVVRGDSTLLTMLLRNLIGNSVKFRADRPLSITITAELVEEPDDSHWKFAVSDNGIGIDRDYAEKVFVIFQRLHPRDRYEGTGIGLAIAKRLVEFHGGQIWVSSQHEGPGTTIYFTIPDGRTSQQ